MKSILFTTLFFSTISAAAETITYHCHGISVSSMGSAAKREEGEEKTYLFVNGETEIFSERVLCDFSESVIYCRSEKFNRTLEIERTGRRVKDLYEIFKHGQQHVKIEFNGSCMQSD